MTPAKDSYVTHGECREVSEQLVQRFDSYRAEVLKIVNDGFSRLYDRLEKMQESRHEEHTTLSNRVAEQGATLDGLSQAKGSPGKMRVEVSWRTGAVGGAVAFVVMEFLKLFLTPLGQEILRAFNEK